MTNGETMPLFRTYSTRFTGYRYCLVCVALLLLTRTLAGATADDGSVASPVESQSEEGGPSGREQRSFGRSSKIDTKNNSPALNNFLEDVRSVQEELKWIDHGAHRWANAKDVKVSSDNRKNDNRKSREEHRPKTHKPQRIYVDDEIITKREVNRNETSSPNSLASLKRTILELSDSLKPQKFKNKRQKETNVFESKRQLLWSENLRSAKGVAIEYYDYDDGADSAASRLDNIVEREAKREDPGSQTVEPSEKYDLQKKDENKEEEMKEEQDRKKLKNKSPKEEFISDTEDLRAESVAPTTKENQETVPPSSNSLINSVVLKRIPAAAESEDSDFYSQCKAGSLSDKSDVSDRGENSIVYEQHPLVDSERSNMAAEDDKPHLSVERTYLVISPEIESKRSRKRSVDPMESSSIVGNNSGQSSSADKSARNYFALKITDDMFKGGFEQSNPLGEDKPIESASFYSSPSSVFGNGIILLKSFKTKAPSPEWKVIEAIGDNGKILQPENVIQPERIFGRRLTQIIHENSPSHPNYSSASLSSSTDNQLSSTTLTHQRSTTVSTNENSTDIDVKTHRENVHHQNNFQNVLRVNSDGYTNFSTTSHEENLNHQSYYPEVFHVSSDGRKHFSITLQSLATTTAQLYNTTLGVRDSSVMNESHNKTRPRRRAGSYTHVNLPKHRRVQHNSFPESVGGRKGASVDAFETDPHHRKLTALLAADNIEDESQINLAMHGELAGKIVERIFEEVQRNEGLKVGLGPGLYRKHKPQESIELDKMYRQGLDDNEVKETEAMMRRVMELLGRLVLDEVRRKTCTSLAPDMRDFLQWSLGIEELAEPLSDEVPPLPVVPDNRLHDATERLPPSADKFLFQGSPGGESLKPNGVSELERKVSLLKGLIKEYLALSEREKTKVQTVHDYLVRQLALLMKFIESKEAAEQSQTSERTGIAGARSLYGKQHILQYQGSVPNQNFEKSQENVLNMTGNEAINNNPHASISERPMIFPPFNGNPNDERVIWHERKKRKHGSLESGRARRRKVRDRSSYDAGESFEYRKLLHRIATLRRKKRDDSWGYEIPRIYSGPVELPSIPRVSFSTIADPVQPITPFSVSSLNINSSTPVRGKNRLKDEVLHMNKREAWRKENERLLEEVAFGKDVRNDLIPGGLGRLFNQDKEVRMKREFDGNTSPITLTTPNNTLKTNETANYNNQTENFRSMEQTINVFTIGTKNMEKNTSDIHSTSQDAPNLS